VKSLASFYDFLMPELKGITTAMLDLHLRLWARDFCAKTHVWRADFDPVNLVASRATYDLDASASQAEPVKVIRLRVNDELLYDELWTEDSQGDDEPKYERGNPPFTVNDTCTELTLMEDEIPTAAVTDGLEVYGSMRPKMNATQLPDLFYGEHLEALRTGVLSRLMVMPGKPWTDRELATFYGSEANRLALAAATRAQRGNTRAPLRTRKWG
jgi:hypothetical protein